MSLLKRRLCHEYHEGVLSRPGATNVITTASGEIDLQLSIRRTLYGFGLGQGMMGLNECYRFYKKDRFRFYTQYSNIPSFHYSMLYCNVERRLNHNINRLDNFRNVSLIEELENDCTT
jgi:hypothetical protein